MSSEDTNMLEDTIPMESVIGRDSVMADAEEENSLPEEVLPSLMLANTQGTSGSYSSSEGLAESPTGSTPPSSGWHEVEDQDLNSYGSDESFCFSDDEVLAEIEDCVISSKPFDMALLKSCIQRGSPTLDKIAGKDVVLVVGKTGSGKSTFIQGVAGKKFRATKHAAYSKGESFEKLVFEAEEPLQGFEIGHEKVSKTTAINCFERSTGRRDPAQLFYVDSPGFEDTSGLEVDIATSVMLSKVAQQCKSLRFVIIINYTSLMEARGDAMRAVLKIIRTFVEDFEKDKRSFLFLFSHTTGFLPEHTKAANRRLLGEIVHTLQGTKDEDVMTVLRFIKTCLERNYPFVKIFHPLQTDFADLTKFVESKLGAIKKPALAATCGLTLSSQLRLRGEVKSMILNLRNLLASVPVDTAQVISIKETLEYLGENIAIADVSNAIIECKDAVDRFCLQEKLVIDEEIERGTNLAQQFSRENTLALYHAMRHLKDLIGLSEDSLVKRLTPKLQSFKSDILIESFHDFRTVALTLDKLRVWGDAFNEYDIFYEEAVQFLHDRFEVLEKRSTMFLSLDLGNAAEREINASSENMKIMSSIIDHKDALAEHSLRVDKIFALQEGIKKYTLDCLLTWKDDFDRRMWSDPLSSSELRELGTRAKALSLLGLLFETVAYRELYELSSELLQDIKHVVVGYYQNSSRTWATSISPLTRYSFDQIKTLQEGARFFSELGDPDWKETGFACVAIIASVRSRLLQLARSVNAKAESARKNGISDASVEGCALVGFDDLICFDELFDLKDRFMKNSSTKMHHDYTDRMNFVSKSVHASLQKLLNPNADSSIALNDMKIQLAEAQEVSHLACLLGEEEFSHLENDVNSKLLEFVDKMSRRGEACIKNWNESLENGPNLTRLKKETAKLDSLLHEMKHLGELSVSAGVRAGADCVAQLIKDSFASFTHTVDNEFSSNGDFEVIKKRLACIEQFQEFTNAIKFLPAFEVCRQRAADVVSEKARSIEGLVEETAEFDKIDQLIVDLERATAIDEFINFQASSRLGPLRKLRVQKEDDVDTVLVEMISKNDFKGIGQLLSPLADSQDQLKRKKFNAYADQICSGLREQISQIKSSLSSFLNDQAMKSIVHSLKTLEDAESEIGRHLTAKFNLQMEVRCLKRSIGDKLDSYLANFELAKKELNFGRMAVAKSRASLFVQYLGINAPFGAERKVAKASREYDAMLHSISVQVDKFLNESFSNSLELLKLLDGLKRGAENSHKATAELSNLYNRHTTKIETELVTILQRLNRRVSEQHCYHDGIELLLPLIRDMAAGLDKHVNEANFPFDCKIQLKTWQDLAEEEDYGFNFDTEGAEEALKKFALKLDGMKSPSFFSVAGIMAKAAPLFGGITYERHCQQCATRAAQLYSEGIASLRGGDFDGIQKRVLALNLMNRHLAKHVPIATSKYVDIKRAIQKRLVTILEDAVAALTKSNVVGFEGLFLEMKGIVLGVPCSVEHSQAEEKIRLMNQLVLQTLNKQIDSVLTMLRMESDPPDFLAVKKLVEDARYFGSFAADHFTLFHEQAKGAGHVPKDEALSNIVILCHQHFGAGRDFSNMRYFATLGLVPSSNEQDIRRAYKAMALLFHPDKSRGDTEAKFREIKEAHDALLGAASKVHAAGSRAFDHEIKSISEALRRKAKQFLNEERYDAIDRLLFSLPGLNDVKDLVDPELDSQRIQHEVEALVKEHINKVKVEVDSLWALRKYRDLNDTIEDLRLMEQHLKSHARVFSKSWNEGIIRTIELEIKDLGKEARKLLSSKTVAKENESEFRRCFLAMGSVLVELPTLKDFTKKIMADVLESCLVSEWGFSYLFELGLSLHWGGDDDDGGDTAHVAHFILAEFSHFKEVLTMAWNTETTQKPAEDTVKRIMAHSLLGSSQATVEQGPLLESFAIFETQYNAMLGEYIRPEADKAVLAHKIIRFCKSIQPVTCSGGWSLDVRQGIPKILGGVFALFTICKSGDSFNRIGESMEASRLGQQILMKPHNIQVLTLLYMFGCSSGSGDDLESQLLQIRTGEGKSMILGAAAAVLGLLGFRVRCVCYSEYLSNRDYALFKEVFAFLGLESLIKYSKITALSEDTTASKGDIRGLTGALLRGDLKSFSTPQTCEAQSNCQHRPSLINEEHPVGKSREAKKSPKSFVGYKDSGVNEVDFKVDEVGNSTTSATTGSTNVSDSLVACPQIKHAGAAGEEEILLVDEVDVFFGAEFYGQTYNQVSQIRGPEIQTILKQIWAAHKNGGRKLRLADIKATDAYGGLLAKLPMYEFVIENEISLMLDDVRQLEDEPYFLGANGRIGYKIMDTICFDVTLGYRTSFAYLKEYDAGNLDDKILEKALSMNVSCGQFSYANIHPARILGVSGTLDAMGAYEKQVLGKYGVKKFIYMPSVYGQSNFEFERTGDGIFIESGESDYFHKICSEISAATGTNRAVIVFFENGRKLSDFSASAFYRKLGRKKTKLSEDMDATEKDFVIKKASTAGQLTICSAVFGRGTDFFCKDQKVQDNGGVLIIQTFLSSEKSEEIQIQGRTARQGKRGAYKLVLLDSDLETNFGVQKSFRDQVPKNKWYEDLCRARDKRYGEQCTGMDANLADASSRDKSTHQYFDALLAGDQRNAGILFKEIYSSMKKRAMPSCVEIDLACVIDVTGSMSPYVQSVNETMQSLLHGKGAIVKKLSTKFPEIEFKLRVGPLAFRDIEDATDQFCESLSGTGSHFFEDVGQILQVIQRLTASPRGGQDLAEDILGALNRCVSWDKPGDWASNMKFVMLMTDAPAHGMVPSCSRQIAHVDKFSQIHPLGLAADYVAGTLVKKGIDLFYCSFNPNATAVTEERLSKAYQDHPDNTEGNEVTCIPMVPKQQLTAGVPALSGCQFQHIIFVLDMSSSMQHNWSGVVVAYQNFVSKRLANQNSADLVSVVQFDDAAHVTVNKVAIESAPGQLGYGGRGTYYTPAAHEARNLAISTPSSHTPVVIFMSDGETSEADALNTAQIFQDLNQQVLAQWGREIELHVIAFGHGLDQRQLSYIMRSSGGGRIHTSVDVDQLNNIFVQIAQTSDVAQLLEEEIARRISEAVSNKVALEYLG